MLRGLLIRSVLSLLVACGAPSVTPARTSGDASRPRPALSEGPYGGLAELEQTPPLPILASDRVRVPVPRASLQPDVLPGSTTGTILRVQSGESRLIIVAQETFRSTPASDADYDAAIRRSLGRTDRAWFGTLAGAGGFLILEAPGGPGDVVPLATGLIPGPDGYLVHVAMATDRQTAQTGGCQRLAVRLLDGARPGERRLYVEAGPRRLLGDVGLTLPSAHHVSMLRAISYLRLQVAPLAPLGAKPASLEITIGRSHRTRSLAQEPTSIRRGTLLGQTVAWVAWRSEDGRYHREARLGEDSNETLRVLVVAGDEQSADALQAVAALLRSGVEPSHVRCGDGRRLPSFWGQRLEVPPTLSSDYLLLRGAQAFAWAGGFRPAPEREAFQRLAASPEGVVVFRALAQRATDAGRLYGLAGLYLLDPADFAPAVCAVRPTLGEQVSVRESCGESTQPTESLIVSAAPDAIRGEIHWDPMTWSMASGSGTPDLIGGGLSHALLRRDPEDVAAWALEGEGHAVVPGDALPVVSAPAPVPPPPVLAQVGDQMCASRADGRTICFGGRDGESAAPRLIPDVIRNPRSLIRPNGATCGLDTDGQRICFGRLLDGPIRERGEACGEAVDEHAVGVRRFADGPFRELFAWGDGCGLTEDGLVRCFVLQRNRMPDWVDAEGVIGFGASYPVPISGLAHAHGGFAWTRDGVVYEMGRHRSPERIGQLPGPIRSVAGTPFGPAFFQLQDGRVLAYAIKLADDGSPVFWEYANPRAREEAGGEPFTEVPALRGAEIYWSGDHGCAQYSSGRVSCFGWNQSQAIGPGEPQDRSPRDVAAFRNAEAIFPAQRYTCALLSRGRLRCYGDFAETIDPEARVRTDGSRELDLGRILSRAREE